tara:strand:+ start:26 stop:553 length:528 start_codon:yes stop_codon:yes gene_type:complete
MPCSICKQVGHNRRSCIDNVDNININNKDLPQPKSIEIDNASPKCINMCVICLNELTTQPITQLKCLHYFCSECLMTNISHGDTTCPLCRDSIIEPNRQIDDLKQQITSLESLNFTTQHQLIDITSELVKINLHSLSDLNNFIISYKIMQQNMSERGHFNFTTTPIPVNDVQEIN